jgi:hypothetical protein
VIEEGKADFKMTPIHGFDNTTPPEEQHYPEVGSNVKDIDQ